MEAGDVVWRAGEIDSGARERREGTATRRGVKPFFECTIGVLLGMRIRAAIIGG